MNAIIKKAHKIRREAAAKFGGKPGQYSMQIACVMAKNGEEVDDTMEKGKNIAAAINNKYKIDIRYYDKGVYGSKVYTFAVCKSAKSKKAELMLSYAEFPTQLDVEREARKVSRSGKKEVIEEIQTALENNVGSLVRSAREKNIIKYGDNIASLARYLDLSETDFAVKYTVCRIEGKVTMAGIVKMGRMFEENGVKCIYGYLQ